MRNEREDVEPHQLARSPAATVIRPRLEVDRPHAVLDDRQQHARCRARARRSRRPGHGLARARAARPPSSTTSSPIELEGVVLVLLGRRQRVALDLERRAALDGPVELHDRPAGRRARAATTSTSLPPARKRGAALQPALVVARLLDEERAVEPVRPADPADRTHSSPTRLERGDRLVARDRLHEVLGDEPVGVRPAARAQSRARHGRCRTACAS